MGRWSSTFLGMSPYDGMHGVELLKVCFIVLDYKKKGGGGIHFEEDRFLVILDVLFPSIW